MRYFSNSDFLMLAGILCSIGAVGIYEGYEMHPAAYSQSAILFGSLGFMGYKTFYADKKEKAIPSVNPEGSRPESQ